MKRDKNGTSPSSPGNVIRRYYANGREIKNYEEYIESRRYNNDNGLGRGDSEKTSGTDEGIIQRVR